jgi:two-component system, cell cycle sensor histidine kinase and response regulator CckA
VAHDFNNILTVIKGHAGMMLEQAQSGDALHSSGRQIEQAADRAASLTRQLLAFCRMQVLQPKVLNVNALISDMAKMLTRLVRADIHFSFHPDDSLGRVKADPGQLEQVILNFTVNAVDAMPNGGSLRIETQNVTVDGGGAINRPGVPLGSYVMLAVTDTGCGMDAQTKARIFEPFFTTKEVGKGTGLGLATVYGVIKQSGGWIWVESEPGKGSRFEVYLPRVVDAEDTVNATAKTAVAAARGQTIMIAEDEDGVRDLASNFLTSAGYKVLSASSGGEALECARRWGKPIHLLLTDMVMPQMRGPELARKLTRLYPEIKTVYMSGYHDRGESDERTEGGPLLLQKPFSRDNLLSVVAQALEGVNAEEKAAPATRATATMKTPRRLGRRNGRRVVV